jgi:hypothetical protein
MDPNTPQRDSIADDLQGIHQNPDAQHDDTSREGQDRAPDVRDLNAQDSLGETPISPDPLPADAPPLQPRQTDAPIEAPLEDEA